jgi:hypothetical protein
MTDKKFKGDRVSENLFYKKKNKHVDWQFDYPDDFNYEHDMIGGFGIPVEELRTILKWIDKCIKIREKEKVNHER